MVYTKNKNHIKRKRKRKNKTIKKSKRKFIGGGEEEFEIQYVEDNFKLIDTESENNKCLYFAFYRANYGRLESPTEELRSNIKQINQGVYDYMKNNRDKHPIFTDDDILIANPDSEAFQKDAHVLALANIHDTVILVHELNGEEQRANLHFTEFIPKNYDRANNKNKIIFMSNKGNNHYSALIPNNEVIYRLIVEAIKKREVSSEEIQKSGVVFANRESVGSTPQPQASTEKEKLVSFNRKITDLEDEDEANDSENEYDNEVLQTIEGDKPPQGRPETPSLIHPDQLKPSLSTRSPGPETPSLIHPQQRPKTPLSLSRPETPRPTSPSRRARAPGQSQRRSKINTNQIGEAEKTAAPEQTSTSTGSGLPSTSFADNINRAGNILPKLEPLPVLVGLVGLGVILTIN